MTKRSIIAIVIIIGLSYLIFAPSCANTTTPPSGGPKDTIPPVLLTTDPPYNTTNHLITTQYSSITFYFDEYVVLKDANKNIFLSPPQSKPVEAKIKGKSIVVSFREQLDSNTTYSLDLGNAIADNNEGILFPRYIFSFSTGKEVDSIYTTGSIVDASSLLPLENYTILFHSNLSDSAVYKSLPAAIGRSDKWGFFTIRNLKPIPYRVYAIQDENNNYKYDPESEKIAFIDSLYTPNLVMNPNIKELASYDIKDTLGSLTRATYIQLYAFKEASSRQFIRNSGRLSDREMYISFSAPSPKIDSIAINGINKGSIITQFVDNQDDSLSIWINDPKPIKDTLLLTISYWKTDDSTKTLVQSLDTLKMAKPKPKYQKDKNGKNVAIVDTVAKYKIVASAENVEQDGYTFEFGYPLIKAPFDSLKFVSVDPKQQIHNEKYIVTQDTLDIRKYHLRLENKMVLGHDYILSFPHRKFIDINGLPCDSTEVKLTIPNNDNLSSFTAEIINISGDYIVELISEKRDVIYRKYDVNTASKLYFPYLTAGKYCLRISHDRNKNHKTDIGSLLENKQPERVLLFRFKSSLGNDAYILNLPERTDLEQTINIQELFK